MTGKNMNFPSKNENEILDWEFVKPYDGEQLKSSSMNILNPETQTKKEKLDLM
jgi:hypothetical protein